MIGIYERKTIQNCDENLGGRQSSTEYFVAVLMRFLFLSGHNGMLSSEINVSTIPNFHRSIVV